MNTLQPTSTISISAHDGGPSTARMACSFTILVTASAAFVVMFIWPLVARFT